jgi:hypothetical protein
MLYMRSKVPRMGTDLHKADKAEVAEQQVEELRPRITFKLRLLMSRIYG